MSACGVVQLSRTAEVATSSGRPVCGTYATTRWSPARNGYLDMPAQLTDRPADQNDADPISRQLSEPVDRIRIKPSRR